jgi:tRNA 2-selenouridine synthase
MAPKFRYNQLMGITGVGKTLFLKELSKNYQTIDFEGLANHKGSILGNIPNKIQPSQKYFETLIYDKLKRFNAKKRVWVEAESIKVGKLNIPSLVWKSMPLGRNIKISSSLDERVKYILKDYKYFTSDPKLMSEALRVLKQIIPKEDFLNIEKSLKKKNYYEFVKALIIYHYDKAYKKTRAESTSIVFDEIHLEKINLNYIRKAISMNKSF